MHGKKQANWEEGGGREKKLRYMMREKEGGREKGEREGRREREPACRI